MADVAGTDSRRAGGWVIVWGIVLIAVGIVAIVAPGVAALAVVLVLSWLFVVAGVAELVYAFQQRRHDGFGWKLVSALATLALGLVMLVFPVASIASLALLIGGFIFASGISTAMLALRIKPKAGWGWVLFDGVLSIVIAILIATGWPQSSDEFVGILVGFCLIAGGIWRIVQGRALRSEDTPGR
jgi:uncharacterized membrane protein HdeD (DUF308 family)